MSSEYTVPAERSQEVASALDCRNLRHGPRLQQPSTFVSSAHLIVRIVMMIARRLHLMTVAAVTLLTVAALTVWLAPSSADASLSPAEDAMRNQISALLDDTSRPAANW